MAGTIFERQEQGVINAIQQAIHENGGNPISVATETEQVNNIIFARKYTGRQESGSEPYTDLQLCYRFHNNLKTWNVSMKGESAPSLAGGGLRGLDVIVPGLIKNFNNKVYKTLIEKGYKDGDNIPDIFAEIPEKEKISIVVGNEKMGGPIHYMYIGPMDVKAKYDASKNILTLNGKLIESKRYARNHKLFFRLRKRREDQRFDIKAITSDQYYRIFGKSPSKGDIGGRLVITDKPSNKGIMIKL